MKHVIIQHSSIGQVIIIICKCAEFHLKWSQSELYEESSVCARVLWQEGEYHVVHPEQGDEEQGRFGQSPARAHTHSQYYTVQCVCVRLISTSAVSLEVTGVIPTNTWRPQLLDQDTDHVDEDDEIHLHKSMSASCYM